MRMPWPTTPDEPDYAKPISASDADPAYLYNEVLVNQTLSRLTRMASAFAVYASCRRCRRLCKTRFLLAATLYRAGVAPAGFP